jgi:hypothetical protein
MLLWRKKRIINKDPIGEQEIDSKNGANIFEVWKEYEAIAMHFNDLIIQLRIRALGGIAAISAVVGFIYKENSSELFRWGILGGVFFKLIIVWSAIWIIDFYYYNNRLLAGAVYAIKEVEKLSEHEGSVQYLNMSTRIEQSVRGKLPKEPNSPKRRSLGSGRMLL